MAAATFMTAWCLALALAGAKRTPDAELIRQAEAAFHAGFTVRQEPDAARPLFRKAAICYEQLCLRGFRNADLYRNLGNSYLLVGDLPRAILSYRRGLRLAPTDPVLRANLTQARGQVAYPESRSIGWPPADDWPPWLPCFSPLQRALLFFCAYTLGWLGIVRWWMTGRNTLLTASMVVFSLAAFAAGSLVLQAWSEREDASHPLVVVAADGVFLRKGNGSLYPPRREKPLNRGVEARLLFERSDWLQIELSGGQIGWIPRVAALIDQP